MLLNDNLLYAKLLMGGSLGFHIIFAAIGIALPLFFVVTEGLWLITKKDEYLYLTKIWSNILAVLFAVGAVSGTVLSFELGLLWPKFMEFSGPIIGLAFSLEAVAFFLEAIFIGLYFYAWDHIPKFVHWLCGVMVALGGVCSAIFVFATNSWMHDPQGFQIKDGIAINIDPLAVAFNRMYVPMTLHMLLAALIATLLLIMGVHAFLSLRDHINPNHKAALKLCMIIFVIVMSFMLFSSDYLAKTVAKVQPIKLAAMEGLYHSQTKAPIIFAGIPDDKTQTTKYAIEIPLLLSLLAYADTEAQVLGLDAFDPELWPNTKIVHWSFDLMVTIGLILTTLAILIAIIFFTKKNLFYSKAFLKFLIFCSPLGFIAIEAGWITTEVGRQPWIINGIMKTSEAVVFKGNVALFFYLFLALYLLLLIISIVLSYLIIKNSRTNPV